MTGAYSSPISLSPPRRLWAGAAAAIVVVLALGPLLAAAVGSLAGPAGASKYVHWWGTSRGWEALGRTAAVSFPAAGAAVLLGWLLAVSAVRWSARLATPLALLSCLPMLVPSSTLATAWLVATAPQGHLGRALAAMGLSVLSKPAAAMVLALRYFGIAAVILTWRQLRQLGEWPAEKAFRVSRWAAAVHLHLRPAARASAAAGLLVALLCINDHIIPGMLMVSTYGPQVMIQYSALLDLAGAAALAIPVAGVGMALAGLALWSGGAAWTRTTEPTACRRPRGSLAGRVLAAGVALAVLAAALALPLAFLIGQAGNPIEAPLQALREGGRELRRTLYFAAVASPICVAVAAGLAHHWVRRRREGGLTAVPLVLLNLTVPPTLLAIGMIELSRAWPLRLLGETSWPLAGAYVVRFLPVASLAFYAAWRNDSPLPALAARVHGVAAWRTAWRVAWPRCRSVVLAVALLTAVLIATELEMSILLAEPGGSTLGIRLYNLIHTAPDSVVSALTLGILALVAPWIVLLVLLLSRGREGAGASR